MQQISIRRVGGKNRHTNKREREQLDGLNHTNNDF